MQASIQGVAEGPGNKPRQRKGGWVLVHVLGQWGTAFCPLYTTQLGGYERVLGAATKKRRRAKCTEKKEGCVLENLTRCNVQCRGCSSLIASVLAKQ